MLAQPIRIGSRGSPLALAQVTLVRQALARAFGLSESDAETAFETVIIKTSGDAFLDRPLKDLGGKGLFTKEIEVALAEGGIDLAVHSMKDMPTVLPPGLVIQAILPREDPRDGLIAREAKSLAELPEGAVVGTASLRREAILRAKRPDLTVTMLRGNVGSRLEKVKAGAVDATFLAMAGLNRLGLAAEATPLETDDMLPAIAQGAVGLEVREGDPRMEAVCAALDHRDSALTTAFERGFLGALDGSCRTPISGLAKIDPAAGVVAFEGAVFLPDGSDVQALSRSVPLNAIEGAEGGLVAGASLQGRLLGEALRAQAGEAFFETLHRMSG